MPFGLNGCHLLSVPVFTTVSLVVGSILHLTPGAIGQCFWRSISPNAVRRANLLLELLLLRSVVLTFSSSGFSPEEVNSIVEMMLHATSFLISFFFLFLCLYSVYDFIININRQLVAGRLSLYRTSA